MDDRSREIFRRIVTAYLETGEPIGSRSLSGSNGLGVSPATIRNTMADLTEMGLLYAPHISAGRMPTDKGLRIFVDGLLEIGNLSEQERRALEQESGSPMQAESLLDQAAARLSGLAHTASLVTTSTTDVKLKHIEFVQTAADQALAVLVTDNGDVENRMLKLPIGLPASALVEASNYINARMQGRSLAEARQLILQEIQQNRTTLDHLTNELVKQGVAELSGSGDNLIVRGQANLLTDEQSDNLERVRMLFEDLEQKKDVIGLLEAAKDGEGVRIFIGSENSLFSLSGSSVIVKPYRDKTNQIIGVVGVIGPTRLNYAKIIPMVDYTAELVTKMIR